MENFKLEKYLSNGVENIVKGALKASITNPKESIYMMKYASFSKQARKLRQEAEEKGEHIPPFLIASITTKCNLHCKGCYSRENHACGDTEAKNQLRHDEWFHIFEQAKNMGIGFILLAGGEPMMRKDVILEAGKIPEILFPIFTNGTMLEKEDRKIFENHRNLVPILSIEGQREGTDQRRGVGTYNRLIDGMEHLNKDGILYGVSITVTKQNKEEVTSTVFLNELSSRGCKAIIYVEYVPVDKETKDMAFGDEEREWMKNRLLSLRQERNSMILISFPGDEKTSGGCLAAGRGFFHINAHGGAEPCPFSPYSDTSLRDVSLQDALNSPLFRKLKDENVLMEEHKGGCVLFEKQEIVEGFLA